MYHGEIEKSIGTILEKGAKAVFADLGIHPPEFPEIRAETEIPKDKSHGDLSTNIAMRASKIAKKSPSEFAHLLKPKIEAAFAASELKNAIALIEVKPPGFINFFLSFSRRKRYFMVNMPFISVVPIHTIHKLSF